jgi:copper(I)-binding protein
MKLCLTSTTRCLIGALCLGAAALASAQAPGVSVSNAWARATVPGQQATGAYLDIVSSEGGALVGATSPVAGTVEVHQMSLENGVMKMRAAPRLVLPAGETVSLKPGGYHVMLMDLKQALREGDKVPLTLKLEGKGGRTGTMEVQAEVRSPSGKPAGGDDMHGHMHHH